MLGQFWVVDKRVAVFLLCVCSVVALSFLFADRVVAVPFQEHIQSPIGEHRVLVAGEHFAVPRRDEVVVACGHVEVGASEVALELIVWFPHRAGVSAVGAGSKSSASFISIALVHESYSVCANPKREIATLVIDITVGGIEVEYVGVAIVFVASPPALGE